MSALLGNIVGILLVVCAGAARAEPGAAARAGAEAGAGPGFECARGGAVRLLQLCDGTADCPDASDETPSLCSRVLCNSHQFRCNYGACISRVKRCDGNFDCLDSSDEIFCASSPKCNETEFRCVSGECIPNVITCDGIKDCADGADETLDTCKSISCPSYSFRCSYGACISLSLKCDNVNDCADGSDEDPTACNGTKDSCDGNCTCTQGQHECKDGGCVDLTQVCDGYSDCEDGSDEDIELCANGSCAAGAVRCAAGGCVPAGAACDGRRDCADGSDEGPQRCGFRPRSGGSGESAGEGAGAGERWCAPLALSERVRARCEVPRGPMRGALPCDRPAPPGTRAQLRCHPYFVPAHAATSVCLRDGSWSRPPPRCVPECGKLGQEMTPLIVNGLPVRHGMWPWQVALYILQSGNWTFWCGGSLISERVVLTAAHCLWKQKTEYLRIAVGKYYTSYDKVEDTTQYRDIRKVVMQPAYQDLNGNYGSDIALLFLESPVEMSSTVRPICIDWRAEYMDQNLLENTTGVILGWGVNENDTTSESLRMTTLVVRSLEHCIAEQTRDFKKYITYTSFCAGYRNGTGVCNGDSGGGLAFPLPHDNATWVVQGVVSVSPRRRGTFLCDPTKYTIFTKVTMYVKWLKAVLRLEGEDLNFE